MKDVFAHAAGSAWSHLHATTIRRRLENLSVVPIAEFVRVGEELVQAMHGDQAETQSCTLAARRFIGLMCGQLTESIGALGDDELSLTTRENVHLLAAVAYMAAQAAAEDEADRFWRRRQLTLANAMGASPAPKPPHGSGAAGGMVERRQKLGTCSCGELVTMTADASGEGWRYRCPRCDRFGAFAR